MKLHRYHKLGVVFLSSALTYSSTYAQSESETVALDEAVSTGTALYSDQVNTLKTPTPIIDVPQSLSITTEDEIGLRGFDSIGDIVDYTPGVNMNQGEGHRDAVVFRGVLSTADFFVDGVRDDVQYYRPLYNVEQVEILRGPNALLFGRGGSGGILNRVTKKAEIGEAFNAFDLSVDTFGSYEAQIDSNVALSETSAFRINAYYDVFENHRNFSDGTGYGVNPSFKFALSDQTTLDVSVEAIDYDRSIDRGIPSGDDGKPMDSLNDVVFGDPDLNMSEFESLSFRALLQHSFSDTLKGVLTASYTDNDKLYQNLYAKNYDEADHIATLDGYVDTTERQNFVLSGNLAAEFETGDIKHTVLFGSEFISSDSKNDRYTDVWGGSESKDFNANGPFTTNGQGIDFDGAITSVAFSSLYDDTTTDLTVYSFYVQDEIELFDQLTFVLGARFDSFDIDVDGQIWNKGAKALESAEGSQKDEEFTPRAGLVYKPKEDISLYASYSQTFVPQSGEQFANLGDAGLDPDEFTNLEAGFKWDLADDQSVTLAIFKIEQDLVTDDGEGGSLVKEAEIEGFEAQYLGQITDQWTVSAGYTYLTGEDKDGDRPGELPKSSFSIWNSYQLTDKFALGLGAIYQGDSTPKGGSDTVTVPSFTRVDAAAYYQLSDNLRLQLNVENLLDEEYYPNAYGTYQFTVGAPINARFAISGKF